jgi:hypothetical protein
VIHLLINELSLSHIHAAHSGPLRPPELPTFPHLVPLSLVLLARSSSSEWTHSRAGSYHHDLVHLVPLPALVSAHTITPCSSHFLSPSRLSFSPASPFPSFCSPCHPGPLIPLFCHFFLAAPGQLPSLASLFTFLQYQLKDADARQFQRKIGGDETGRRTSNRGGYLRTRDEQRDVGKQRSIVESKRASLGGANKIIRTSVSDKVDRAVIWK